MQTLGEFLRQDEKPQVKEVKGTDGERSTAQEIAAMLKYNKKQQEVARELNTRAGEEVFKTYSRQELAEWIAPRLNGAKRLAEVADPSALRLPKLNGEMAQKVRDENPERLVINGVEREVKYKPGRNPQVVLLQNDNDEWMALPDEGVKTPGGREVEVTVFGYSNTDIPQLKKEIGSYLNRRQWSEWWSDGDKPEIPKPDLTAESIEVPFITTVYGQCVITGEDLFAYGTARIQKSRYSYIPDSVELTWHEDRERVEKIRDESVTAAAEMAAEAQQKRETESARDAAKEARERLEKLSSHNDYDDLEYDLRDKAKDKYYWSSVPGELEEMKKDLAETEALVAKVEAGLEEIRVNRERRENALTQIEKLEEEYGFEAAIVVRQTGIVLVDCTPMEKDTDHAKVSGSIGDISWDEPESFRSDGSTSLQPIAMGETIRVQECDWYDEVLCEAVFIVPKHLRPGFWAVADNGRAFYPIIGWKNGKEVIPDSFEVVEVETVSTITENDLAGLFGGNVRIG